MEVCEVVGGSLYEFVVLAINKEAMRENVSGKKYISSKELHRVLGMKLRIPSNKRMHLIKELLNIGVLSIAGNPECLLRNRNYGELFYSVKDLEELNNGLGK